MSFSMTPSYDGKLDAKDIKSLFFRSITLEHSWNFERMQNVGFAWIMKPILRKLYPDADFVAAMKRHMELYNVTPYVSTLPLGIAAAMEEANATDENFDTSSINAVKVALMGPLSGIGDSLFHGTLRAIATGVGTSLALQGNFLGPILFLLIFNIPQYLCRWWLVNMGYGMGSSALEKLESSGTMQRVMSLASIMGMMVIGAMTMSMSAINFTTAIGIGKSAQTLQDMLTGIVPGLPTLILFGATYWLLKKKVNPLLIMLIMLVLGIAGAFFEFLG